MSLYFGTAQAGMRSVSTGESDKLVETRAGNGDIAVRVQLAPDGSFEIDVCDVWGERIGYLVPPADGKKGKRVLKGRLP